MISIAQITEKIINRIPHLHILMAEGLINLSALARKIKPQVEEELLKPIQEGAITMALKRLTNQLTSKEPSRKSLKLLKKWTVRSNLAEITLDSSTDIQKFLKIARSSDDNFCNVSRGVQEITIIFSSHLLKVAEKIFKNVILSKFQNLASITIKLNLDIVKIPGVYYTLLKIFAWENINLVELNSTCTEFTLVFNQKDIDRALKILIRETNAN